MPLGAPRCWPVGVHDSVAVVTRRDFYGWPSSRRRQPDPPVSPSPFAYFVWKEPVPDDRFPVPSRLSTWKAYLDLRARFVNVTEWLVTTQLSSGVVLQ